MKQNGTKWNGTKQNEQNGKSVLCEMGKSVLCKMKKICTLRKYGKIYSLKNENLYFAI